MYLAPLASCSKNSEESPLAISRTCCCCIQPSRASSPSSVLLCTSPFAKAKLGIIFHIKNTLSTKKTIFDQKDKFCVFFYLLTTKSDQTTKASIYTYIIYIDCVKSTQKARKTPPEKNLHPPLTSIFLKKVAPIRNFFYFFLFSLPLCFKTFNDETEEVYCEL